MAENIKLKDLYAVEQTYNGINTVAIPKADGSGDAYYVQRPVINYTLIDPPSHEIVVDGVDSVFVLNAGDGDDLGNIFGNAYGAVSGKTTKPIVAIAIDKYASGIVTTNNGYARILYLYEELPGSVLKEIIGFTGVTDFTAGAGWGQLLSDDNKNVTGYSTITDISSVVIGIEQPGGIVNADIFYSLLSEVTQEEQTVYVTENGEQTIVPTAGKSGIRKVALNVNVAGGGGGVQPNWEQNDSTAADFIKNRPGAYVQTIAGQTLTFDGDTAGKYVATEFGMVKVSDEIIPEGVLRNGTFTFTLHSESGDETETVNGSDLVNQGGMYGFGVTGVIMLVVTSDAATAMGIEPGTYLGCDTENTPPQAYVSQFVIPDGSTIVELPEAYTEIKQSDWAAVEGNLLGITKGSIKNRIGGFCSVAPEELEISLSFDGTYEGKEHYITNDTQGSPNIIFVKALDYPLTKTQLGTMKSSNWLSLTYGGINYTDPKTEVVCDKSSTHVGYVLVAKFTAGDAPVSFKGLAAFPAGAAINNTIIPPGTYWVIRVSSPNNYFTAVNFGFSFIKQMPSEFLETDFSGRDVSAKSVILESSTANSTKKFKITVDDTGTLKATEVTT